MIFRTVLTVLYSYHKIAISLELIKKRAIFIYLATNNNSYMRCKNKIVKLETRDCGFLLVNDS